jgi:phosphatidylglycerophosphate synthase
MPDYVPGATASDKEAVDGAYCQLVQRRLSSFLSSWLYRHLTPNSVTFLGLGVGAAAAAAALIDQFLPAAVLVQVFGVLSCADGEVARRREQVTQLGDFLDTIVDRIVEVLVIVALTLAAYRQQGPGVLSAGLSLLATVLLLVVTTEKYRSTFHRSYPKRLWEPFFSWFSSGSDGRLLVLTLGMLATVITGSTEALLITLWALAAACATNLAWRTLVLARLIRSQGFPQREEAQHE